MAQVTTVTENTKLITMTVRSKTIAITEGRRKECSLEGLNVGALRSASIAAEGTR